jgi:hypothetical protein
VTTLRCGGALYRRLRGRSTANRPCGVFPATHCLLAPALAVFAVQAIATGQQVRAVLYVSLIGLCLVSHPLGQLLTGRSTVWMKPLLCVVVLIAVLCFVVRDRRSWKRRPDSLSVLPA